LHGAGLGDLLMRSATHAVPAILLPRLTERYQAASGPNAEWLRQQVTNTMVEFAVRLDLMDLLGGVWLTGIGWMLRHGHRDLALLTVLLGALELAVGVGSLFGLLSGSGPHFLLRMFLEPVWALVLGVSIARRPLNADRRRSSI
jgi:hypothetical protein